MRRYETIFIAHPDLSEEEIENLSERYGAIIRKGGGTVVKVEKWGIRKLAYEVKKHLRGYYVFFDYMAPAPLIAEIERNLRIDEKVLKYMTVKTKSKAAKEEIEEIKEEVPPLTVTEAKQEGEAPSVSEEIVATVKEA